MSEIPAIQNTSQEYPSEGAPDDRRTADAVRRHEDGILQNKFATAFYDRVYEYEEERAGGKLKLVNFGPGSFRHPKWTNADKMYEAGAGWSALREKEWKNDPDIAWDMFSRDPVGLDDNTVDTVFNSHVIEHGWNDDVAHFFSEVHRILKPGGIFRIVAPDAALAVRAFEENDPFFFGKYFSVLLRRGRRGIPKLTPGAIKRYNARALIETHSLLFHPENPTQVPEDEALSWIESHRDAYRALETASALSDRDLNHRIAAHVNWFTPEKAMGMMYAAGFTNVRKCAKGHSAAPYLRDERFFDKTDPDMSFYVEARK